MTKIMRHELFDQLEVFDPAWQSKYNTLLDAAQNAFLMDLYNEYVLTASGKDYIVDYTKITDYAEMCTKQSRQESRDRYMSTLARND